MYRVFWFLRGDSDLGVKGRFFRSLIELIGLLLLVGYFVGGIILQNFGKF